MIAASLNCWLTPSVTAMRETREHDDSGRFEITCVNPKADADRRMMVVWEAWAKQDANEAAAQLFRRIYERLADSELLDWWESQRTNTLAPVMDAQGWRLHEADHLRPLAVPFARTLREAIRHAMSPAPRAPETESPRSTE